MTVQTSVEVHVIDDLERIRHAKSPKDKAFIRIILEDGTQIDLSLNICGMIGGIAKGAAERLGYDW